VWDSDEEDVYLKDIVGSPPSVSYAMDDFLAEEDSSIDVLTRSGRMQPPVSTQPMPTTQKVPIPIIEDNDIVKQFKKTKVEMNVWKLLETSREHRLAVMNALDKIGIDSDTNPEGLANFLTSDLPSPINLITFSYKDLPPEGDKHYKALNLTVVCKRMNVPMTLVDNGSAINVCPLRAARMLGIRDEDLTLSTQVIRAYDNTCRQ